VVNAQFHLVAATLTILLMNSPTFSLLITPVTKFDLPPPLPNWDAISLNILLQSMLKSDSLLANTTFAIESSSEFRLARTTTKLDSLIFLLANSLTCSSNNPVNVPLIMQGPALRVGSGSILLRTSSVSFLNFEM
jgi:hypothetical protein